VWLCEGAGKIQTRQGRPEAFFCDSFLNQAKGFITKQKQVIQGKANHQDDLPPLLEQAEGTLSILF